jgi:hypothetical protein
MPRSCALRPALMFFRQVALVVLAEVLPLAPPGR